MRRCGHRRGRSGGQRVSGSVTSRSGVSDGRGLGLGGVGRSTRSGRTDGGGGKDRGRGVGNGQGRDLRARELGDRQLTGQGDRRDRRNTASRRRRDTCDGVRNCHRRPDEARQGAGHRRSRRRVDGSRNGRCRSRESGGAGGSGQGDGKGDAEEDGPNAAGEEQNSPPSPAHVAPPRLHAP